ncbi:MAG: hypothetical protein ACK438_01970 [Flavobacteriales bacterium]|jgi:hypothetical protein
MMKKRFLFLHFLFFTFIGISQINPYHRTVLYTLNKNEIVKSNEFIVQQTLNQNRFACIIADTLNKLESLVFNGKVIFTKKDVWNDVFDIDLTNDVGYIYKFTSKDKTFVNVHGKTEGPFDEVIDESCEMYYVDETKIPKEFDFFYSLAGRWFAYKDGNSKMIDEPVISKNFGGWTSMIIKPNGKRTLDELRGIKVNSDIEIEDVINHSIDGQDYAWVYKNNGSRFVVHGDHIFGPYDDKGYNYIFLKGDHLMFNFVKDGKVFVQIDGKISQPMDETNYDLALFDNGKYFYSFEKKGKSFVNINGQIYGPYDRIPYNSVRVFDNGQFAIVFEKDGKAQINLNGKVHGEELSIYSLEFDKNGNYSYLSNRRDGCVYQNSNGVVTKTERHHVYKGWSSTRTGDRIMESSKEKYEIQSNNKEHTLYTDFKYDYVVIDGKSVGKAPAIKAWYEASKNAFIWNAWEGKELVVYEYPLD